MFLKAEKRSFPEMMAASLCQNRYLKQTVERNQYPTSDQIQCQLSSQDLDFISRGTVRISDQISSPFSMKKRMIEATHEWLVGVKDQLDRLPEDSRITDY